MFQVFADRYKRASLRITSNLPFSEWQQVFQGERMTAALLDGKAHAAVGVRCGVEIPGLRRSLEFEGRRYYYCEATPTGSWRFGEMPAELAAKLKRNIPIPLD